MKPICPICNENQIKKRGAKSCGPCYLSRFNRSAAQRERASKRATERWAGRDWDEVSLKEKKKRVLAEQDGKCLKCGQGEVWNGEPLVLQLDHIDGDNSNNERSNLRCLCPNCHTQTTTFCSRNLSNEARKKVVEGGKKGGAELKKRRLNFAN